MRCAYKNLVRKPEQKRQVEIPRGGKREIRVLILITKKYDIRMWIGFGLLRVRICGGLL
jgi:hypothetical protein